MIKGDIRPRTLKRAAVLRELVSLGCGKWKAAELTGVSTQSIHQICKRTGVHMPRKWNTNGWLSDLILRDYHKELGTEIMAERYGTTRHSVRQAICRLRKEGKLPPVANRG